MLNPIVFESINLLFKLSMEIYEIVKKQTNDLSEAKKAELLKTIKDLRAKVNSLKYEINELHY